MGKKKTSKGNNSAIDPGSPADTTNALHESAIAEQIVITGVEHNDNKNIAIASEKDDDGETSALLSPPLLPPPHPSDELTSERIVMGIGYMLAMGVCGVVLVAIGSTLDELAEKCGYSSTEVGTVFIARGIGAVVGAISSAKLYMWLQGNHVMAVSLGILTILICALPFNNSYIGLHIYFLTLGLGTAVTDTGCQIMTRKLHGKNAGPWLGANTVAFGISGAIVPLIEIVTGNIYAQYYILSLMIFTVTLLVALGPNPERNGKIQGGPKKGGPGAAPHYYVEVVIGFMVFCFIGGKVTSTAYLGTYVDQTGVIDAAFESKLVLVLWVAITVGRLAGVQDQRFLTNKTLPIHLSILCIGGVLSMLLVLWFPSSGTALWVGVAFYGLFNGPCVGYCYDLNNRITYPSEQSMSIVMFGLNFGASLVPYITTLVWNRWAGPETLIVVIFMSMFLPLPLLHATKYLSYDPTVNPRMKNAYTEIPNTEDVEAHESSGIVEGSGGKANM